MKSLNLLIILTAVFTMNLVLLDSILISETDSISPFSVCKILDTCKKEG